MSKKEMIIPLDKLEDYKDLIIVSEKEYKQLKEVIEEVREYIDNNSHYFAIDGSRPGFVIDKEEQVFCEELLQILDKVKD